MASTYKPLGQSFPGAASLTDCYTVPAGKQTVVSSITVAEQSGTATTYRVAVAPGGAADAPEQYLAYDIALAGNAADTYTLGVTLQAGDVVRVYANDATVSFNVYGEEMDADSPLGVLASADFLFTEVASDTTYTATMPILAGSVVADILLYNLALWDAATATFTAGDGQTAANAYYDAIDLLDISVYDPNTGSGGRNVNDAGNDYKFAPLWLSPEAIGPPHVGIHYAASDTLTMTVTTAGSASPAGILLVKVLYIPPVAPIGAVSS